MMAWRAAVFAVLGAAAIGCNGPHPFIAPPGDVATCTPFKMVLLGNLDGQMFNVAVGLDNSNFQQATLPYSYGANFGTGMVQLSFNDVISRDAGAATTGTIIMPPGTPHAGETICVGGTIFTTTLPGGSGSIDYFEFSLTPMSPADASSASVCPGALLAGALSGCAP